MVVRFFEREGREGREQGYLGHGSRSIAPASLEMLHLAHCG